MFMILQTNFSVLVDVPSITTKITTDAMTTTVTRTAAAATVTKRKKFKFVCYSYDKE